MSKIETIKSFENKVVVTRHPALVQYLQKQGLVDEDTPVLEHVTPEDVKGKNVIGVLPLSLACHALSVTEIPLNLTREMRGRELTYDDMCQIAGEPEIYRIEKMTF